MGLLPAAQAVRISNLVRCLTMYRHFERTNDPKCHAVKHLLDTVDVPDTEETERPRSASNCPAPVTLDGPAPVTPTGRAPVTPTGPVLSMEEPKPTLPDVESPPTHPQRIEEDEPNHDDVDKGKMDLEENEDGFAEIFMDDDEPESQIVDAFLLAGADYERTKSCVKSMFSIVEHLPDSDKIPSWKCMEVEVFVERRI